MDHNALKRRATLLVAISLLLLTGCSALKGAGVEGVEEAPLEAVEKSGPAAQTAQAGGEETIQAESRYGSIMRALFSTELPEDSLSRAMVRERTPEEERLLDEVIKKYLGAPEVDRELRRLAVEDGILYTIYFRNDAHSLDRMALQRALQNGAWLRETPRADIFLAGHTTSPGSDEFNAAVGNRRVQTLKRFLTDLGIEADRVSTISYGEDKPAGEPTDDDARFKDNRVEFIVVY